ncbi:MAG: hypothetical protein ACTSVY_13265 [Candidatus Helarchaeota archaeon]
MSEPTQENKSNEIVIIKSKAYKQIILHSSRFCNPNIPRSQWKEVYGFLIGTVKDNEVIVEDANPMTHGGTTEVQFEEKHYIKAAELDSKLAVDGKYFIVGWYHSHPGLDLFLSSVDIQNHMGFQGPNPKSIALVCDPTKMAVAGHTGFEIFKIKEISPTSGYYTVPWKIDGVDHLFLGRTLFELAEKSSANRPVVEEYGESEDVVENVIPPQKPSSEPQIIVEEKKIEKPISPEIIEAQEKLTKAIQLAERSEYEKAIDLTLSLGEEMESKNRYGLASDAFLQVGSIFYGLWSEVYKIRGKIFSHQKEPTNDDIELVLMLAKLLNQTKKRVDFSKIGLELEIRNLSGEMVKINDVNVQITNILYEASEISNMLVNTAFNKKDIASQIKYLELSCDILKTVEYFMDKLKTKSNIVKNIFNINHIFNKMFYNQARILELKAIQKMKDADHELASKYYIGAAKIASEGSQKIINDDMLKNNLVGYSETLMGRGFFVLGEMESYAKKNYCKANGYYEVSRQYFENARNLYPIHAKWDMERNNDFLEYAERQAAKSRGKCLDSKGELKKLTKNELTLDALIDTKELTPLFYP